MRVWELCPDLEEKRRKKLEVSPVEATEARLLNWEGAYAAL